MVATIVFRPMEINIPPEIFLAAVISFFVLLLIKKIFWDSGPRGGSAPERSKNVLIRKADPETMQEIRRIANIDQLMAFVSEYEWLDGEENDLLLAKAIYFEAGLEEEDWAAIYEVAAAGSELERVAKEKLATR